VSGSADYTVKVFNANTYELEATLKSHTDAINTVSFSPDNKFIASGSSDKTIKIWNAENY
jgi:WD40 repeat protein